MQRFPQWTITVVVAFLLLLLTGGFWFYTVQEQHLRQETENELTAIAQLKVNQIAAWRGERLGDAVMLMDNPFFIAGAVQSLADPEWRFHREDPYLLQWIERALRIPGRFVG